MTRRPVDRRPRLLGPAGHAAAAGRHPGAAGRRGL